MYEHFCLKGPISVHIYTYELPFTGMRTHTCLDMKIFHEMLSLFTK